MRYKTFRNLSALGGLAVVGALGYLGARSCSSGPAHAPVATAPQPAPASTAPSPTAATGPVAATDPVAATRPTAAGDGSVPLRAVDRLALMAARTPFGGDKKKDALSGHPFKINLYKDAGKTTANRLKIDLDRDNKWDEKWTFEERDGGPEVKRQVAPADDEKYTEEYRLRAGRWVKKR